MNKENNLSNTIAVDVATLSKAIYISNPATFVKIVEAFSNYPAFKLLFSAVVSNKFKMDHKIN